MKIKLKIAILATLCFLALGLGYKYSGILFNKAEHRAIIQDGVVGGKSGIYTNINGLANEFTNISIYINGLLTSYRINGVEQ